MNHVSSGTDLWLSYYLLLNFLFTLSACEKEKDRTDNPIYGNPITEIYVEGISTDRGAEISGLTWYGDQLILLPQYPNQYRSADAGTIFTISQKEIITYLEKQSPTKLIPKKIEIDDHGIAVKIPGFQGYEAIVFNDNQVYLTVESRRDGEMSSYLVGGRISEDTRRLDLDPESILQLQLPAQIRNMSFESLIRVKDKIVAIFEMNGANVNPNPVAVQIDPTTQKTSLIPFPATEYRITDATAIDPDGRFWVLNYYWPGDFGVSHPAKDILFAKQVNLPSFDKDQVIERIVAFKYSDTRIGHVEGEPIYLVTQGEGSGNNWEGIVRLNDRGFLIVTDKHPKTILAFVAFD